MLKIDYVDVQIPKELLNAHVDHVLEGLVQVVADFLDFHFLSEKVFFHLWYECDYVIPYHGLACVGVI